MPGLLRRDPARLLKTAQPSGMISGHHIAASQVDVMMAPPDRRHRWPQPYPPRPPHSLFAVLQLHGDGHLVLSDIRRAERQPVIIAVHAHVVRDQPCPAGAGDP